MKEELSLTAQQLLTAFTRRNGIETYSRGSAKIYWIAQQIHEIATGETELEAVRALCKQIKIVCEV